MRKAFAIAGYGEEVLEQKFGGMLRALSLGAPPHGGIAPGIDRIVMLLCGEENLREVVLFPMNQRAEDLMMGAPSEVTPKQLRELHIRLALPENKGGLSACPARVSTAMQRDPGPSSVLSDSELDGPGSAAHHCVLHCGRDTSAQILMFGNIFSALPLSIANWSAAENL